MSSFVRTGQRDWRMTRDRDGHREYKITYRVVTSSKFTGPADVLTTAGLPIPGDYWVVDQDTDLWATCKLDASVTPVVTNEPNFQWDVEFTFSTKGDDKRCKDQQWDDPLLVPDRVSGSFTRFTEQARFDRFGKPITNSAFERMEGPVVEFDASRAVIRVSQNRALLEVDLFTPMVDTVNDAPLWGLPARTVKLSSATWERKFYGQCYLYYERTFEFEVRYNPGTATDFLGFDRLADDEASKALNGHWARTGSGTTLDINIHGEGAGPVSSAKVHTGGSGYEPSSVVYLYVTGSSGQGAVVAVETDDIGDTSTGDVAPIVAGGTGYPALQTNVATTPDIRWVLDEVAPGLPPDFRNPNHFARYKDRNGENARALLDGFGKPAPMPRTGFIDNVFNGVDTPYEIETDTPHLLQDGDPVSIQGVGGTVSANGLWLITVVDNTHFTLNGTAGLNPNNKAFDMNSNPTWSTGPGFRLIQKYNESNFLLLGIPTSF